MDKRGLIAVTGATGRQGGAVTRHLLTAGWRVRALTRSPESARARRVAKLGADVVACDMLQPPTLIAAFEGAYGVYSVQNSAAGFDAEIVQGKNVADAAKAAGVTHVVYGSSSLGVTGTGVKSWETKVVVADYLRHQELPLTVLRPTAFMELMNDKSFYPAVSTWHVMPKVMGDRRPVPWLCLDDLGAIAARAFGEPDEFIGADLGLAADWRSIAECREIWRSVTGRVPRSFPMPMWLFKRFVGDDLVVMWEWLRTHDVPADPAEARRLLPSAATIEEWVARQQSDPAVTARD